MGLQDLMQSKEMTELDYFNKIINPNYKLENGTDTVLKLIDKIDSEKYLKDIVLSSKDIVVRCRVIPKINDIEFLKEVMVESVSQTIHFQIAKRIGSAELWLELFFRDYAYDDFNEIDPVDFYKSTLKEIKATGYFQNNKHREEFIRAVLNKSKKNYLKTLALPHVSVPRRRHAILDDYRILALESRKNGN
jgi:hypothetical protein